MSLSVDGAWKAGVWNQTVWAAGVWYEPSRANHGGGWTNYVVPKKKTLKQYKHEYLDYSYFEIEQEEEKVESKTKLAESEIQVNRYLGLRRDCTDSKRNKSRFHVKQTWFLLLHT